MHSQTLRLAGQACPDPSLRGRRARALLVVGAVVIALVPSVGVTGASAAGSGVAVFPGDSIQALVNANPAGTSFVIKAGVHRRQQVTPKNGNSFVGEPGAVLTGEDVTAYAFTGTAVRVTIRNLIVEHYNTPASDAPIHCSSTGYWVVENNEIRFNAHIGIAAGPRWVVRNNYIHHNGQLGMRAVDQDNVIEGNEIAFNNTQGHDP